MRVGYLGPPGTFSEEALRGSPHGADVEAVPFPTIHATVMAVEEGAVERALVPIENALEGAVNATLDALASDAHDVAVIGEAVHAIRNCLIARSEIALDAIAVVISHPQPLGQCARFLREHVAQAAVRTAASTADAVREVAEASGDDGGGGAWAALGPRTAAERYGCRVLREGVDDDADNATRFVWLGRVGGVVLPGDAEHWKTSVVFSGAGDGQPGWLVRCLSEFAFRGVNLTRIESRPLRGRLGHYLFHVDLEGRAEEGPVADAITALRAHCEQVRLLGSYPAAD